METPAEATAPQRWGLSSHRTHIILGCEYDDCHLQNLSSIFKQLKTKQQKKKQNLSPAPVSGPGNLASIRALLTKSYTWAYSFTAIPADNGTD